METAPYDPMEETETWKQTENKTEEARKAREQKDNIPCEHILKLREAYINSINKTQQEPDRDQAPSDSTNPSQAARTPLIYKIRRQNSASTPLGDNVVNFTIHSTTDSSKQSTQN